MTSKWEGGSCQWAKVKTLFAGSTLLVVLLTLTASAQNADVLTQHNDTARTGANLRETQLTPANVKSNFGKLFSRAVDGQVYAQPLVVSRVEIPGKGVRNVVYVATMKNNVYAFDADSPDEDSPLWKRNLGKPVPYEWIPFNFGAAIGQFNIRPCIGITSTPVIDAAKRHLWVVAKAIESFDNVRYELFCLDIKTGAVVATSRSIQAGDGIDRLQARTALQRPGLLLANGLVYVAFGAHQDAGYYHGWLVAFDAMTLEQKYAFCTTPKDKSGEGGIWQSGNGPAADANGNVYIMTGNGDFEPNQHYGSSFVKLDAHLNVHDWFTPSNYKKLTSKDLDLGSAGPMLLPDSNQIIGGGKEGKLYLLNRDHMGRLQPEHSVAPALQVFQASKHPTPKWVGLFDPALEYHHIHGSPVYWKSSRLGPLVYLWPEETRLQAYAYSPQKYFRTRPVAFGPKGLKGMPGGFLSISANGEHDGVLWAATPLNGDAFVTVVQGALRAFDADTLKELWSTEDNTPEDIFAFAKFCPPTICNGKIYLATFSDKLNVYGLVPKGQPLPSWTKLGQLRQ
jgi:outer membrane protein assembly factor BamB